MVRALTKKFSYNELGYNEQSILQSLRVRYNEVLLYFQTNRRTSTLAQARLEALEHLRILVRAWQMQC